MANFNSILYFTPESAAAGQPLAAEDSLVDLHLDRVVAAIAAERPEYAPQDCFAMPLRTVDDVKYRHDVFRDLTDPDIRAPFEEFAAGMRQMRQRISQSQKLYHEFQVSRWHLDAVESYCEAVTGLHDALGKASVRSSGLRAFAEYLADYLASIGFRRLVDETRSLLEELATIRYSVYIDGQQVHVDRRVDQRDYAAEIAETFARFGDSDQPGYLRPDVARADMNPVEEQVLDCVASLYPKVFRLLTAYRDSHRDYLDGTLARFDHEVQFYLAYLAYMRRFAEAGLRFCYPEVTADFDGIHAEETFDLALADRILDSREPFVCNDFRLTGTERILVVTGPNQSGKTAFARMFGQLGYLAAFGMPVPGRRARLMLPDRLFTNFERKESLARHRGKLDAELVRVHDIVSEATARSIIVMNESFACTTLTDAVLIGTEVLQRITTLRSVTVYVTSLDELAALGPATVSMVGGLASDDPTRRTFRFYRRPADGLAHAEAFASRYGLTYQALSARLAARTSQRRS